MGYFIGVDPGVKGALCLLDTSNSSCELHLTPRLDPLITATTVLNWIQSIPKSRIIGLEDVHSIFGASAKSNFQFGRACGEIAAVCNISGFGVDWVTPKVWQKTVGISFPPKSAPMQRKKITAARVAELYPNAMIFGPKGGLLDGRADALMIAHFMSLKYEGGLL